MLGAIFWVMQCVTALGNLLPALFARILSLQTCH